MTFDTFQLAAQRAEQAYSSDDWLNLGPRERSAAIYRELRRIDAARAAERPGRRARAERAMGAEAASGD